MIRVLHVVSSLGSGGVEALLYNYYNYLDRKEIKFDFIVHGEERGVFEEKFLAMGSAVYHVTPRSENPFENILQIRKVIKNNNYKIIHVHLEHMAFIPLYFAKRKLIGTRISHAHLSNQSYGNFVKRISISVLKKISKRYATHFFGCSEDAIVELFGKNIASNNSKVIKNAIDIKKFQYSIQARNVLRNELNIEKNFVLGHIGRFNEQKNHEYLIEIFNELNKINEKSKLILVGEGPLEESVKKSISRYGLQEKVVFLGVRNDINHLMNAFDVFVFPSNYEGLGIVLIEAQACSLQSFTSEKVVPQEANISRYLKYLSLREDPSEWAESINAFSAGYTREPDNGTIRNAGYEIKTQAAILEQFYLKRCNVYVG